jgi:hypothetical protein
MRIFGTSRVRPEVLEVRVLYFGITTRTSTPRFFNAPANPPTARPKPPVLANGTTSEETINTRNGRAMKNVMYVKVKRK